jgi:GntP family gluconate:H+ symporter
VAAVIKTLQGSSLVAAITAAGMIQPLLTVLGLDTEAGHALAVVAIGIGSVTVSHVNDDHFWLVSGSGGLRPWQGLKTLSLGSLLQSIVALLVLFALAAIAI